MKSEMPSPQVLQPVLKMKVDELFLNWLSEPNTQVILKDYLMKIKNGDAIEQGCGDCKDKNTLLVSENNNIASQKSVTERTSASLNAPSSPPSTALPSGSGGSSRAGPNGRPLRRSISSRKDPDLRKELALLARGCDFVLPSRFKRRLKAFQQGQAQVKKEEPVAPALSESIPKFYFPQGRPKANCNIDHLISKIEKIFSQLPNERATMADMGQVAKACECPLYWKAPLFCAAGGDRTGFVSVHKFIAMWRKVLQTCHDDAAKLVHLLAKPGSPHLEQDDFIPFLQDVVNTHSGLVFLKEAPDFHSRYITTVVQRIFYNVNRSWTGKITCAELRKSSLLQNVALLEEEEDVNQLTEFFSYEHFYVIYCKFWELDTDHDLYIDQRDLVRHNDQAISQRMIERIFSGCVTRLSGCSAFGRDRGVRKEGRLSYADFVWFLISEEDKKTDTSVEYWFRCMDLDGDGVLSMYELQHFYQEQSHKLETMAIEPLPFQDCLCQMLDLVRPEIEGKITLRDLKRCKMAHIFYDTFFNIEKYLDHEQKDPFAVVRDGESDGQEMSDWERYAAEEYDILVSEEAANEQHNDGYDDALDTLEHHVPHDFQLHGEKRHFFEIRGPPCGLDLDDYEYEYEDDFE